MMIDPENPKSLCPSVLELPLRQRNLSLKRIHESYKEIFGRAAFIPEFLVMLYVGGSSLGILGLSGYALINGIPPYFPDKVDANDDFGYDALIVVGIALLQAFWIMNVSSILSQIGIVSIQKLGIDLLLAVGQSVAVFLMIKPVYWWMLVCLIRTFPALNDETLEPPTNSTIGYQRQKANSTLMTVSCIVEIIALVCTQIGFYMYVLMVIWWASDFKTVEEDTPSTSDPVKGLKEVLQMDKQLHIGEEKVALILRHERILKEFCERKEDKGNMIVSTLAKAN